MNQETHSQTWENYFTTSARLSAVIESHLKQAVSLSLAEYNVLLQVHQAGEEGIRLGELAHRLIFSPSRLTHTQQRMSERGLLQRTCYDKDKRGGTIHLTDKGEELFQQATTLHNSLIEHYMFSGLTDEQVSAMEEILSSLNNRLNESRHQPFIGAFRPL